MTTSFYVHLKVDDSIQFGSLHESAVYLQLSDSKQTLHLVFESEEHLRNFATKILWWTPEPKDPNDA